MTYAKDVHPLGRQPWWKRVGFFQGMAILFLVLTFVGFAPTFFLRSFSDKPPLPIRLHIHGILTVLWVLLFLLQSFLIAGRKVTYHRRVGIWGTLIASGVLISGLSILYAVATEYQEYNRTLEQVSSLVWGNLAILTAYSTFVILGILNRSKPRRHKRFMLMATLSIMGQPLTRIGHLDLFRVSDSIIVNDAVYGLGGVVLLYVLVGLHDTVKLGRPHKTIVWGLPFQVGLTIITGLFVANSDFGHSLIQLFN